MNQNVRKALKLYRRVLEVWNKVEKREIVLGRSIRIVAATEESAAAINYSVNKLLQHINNNFPVPGPVDAEQRERLENAFGDNLPGDMQARQEASRAYCERIWDDEPYYREDLLPVVLMRHLVAFSKVHMDVTKPLIVRGKATDQWGMFSERYRNIFLGKWD